jgi:Sir2 family
LAGVSRVLQCHGSFATASCINCRRRVPGSEIENDIQSQKVPLCPVCDAASLKLAATSRKKKGKGRKKDGWDSAESDESDEPNFPPGIMKVGRPYFVLGLRHMKGGLYGRRLTSSPTSLSLERSLRTTLIKPSSKIERRSIYFL